VFSLRQFTALPDSFCRLLAGSVWFRTVDHPAS
jgi:hypothetical protein